MISIDTRFQSCMQSIYIYANMINIYTYILFGILMYVTM